jgi:hypothetical protein
MLRWQLSASLISARGLSNAHFFAFSPISTGPVLGEARIGIRVFIA